MLEVCAALMREQPDLRFQTHLNENCREIAEGRAAFPWAGSYLAVHDRFSLAGPRSVFAHDLHVSDAELARLAGSGASVAHCPSSNAMLGSGIFPMRRHLAAGVRFALGSDVGAGIGFGVLKEALGPRPRDSVLPGKPLADARGSVPSHHREGVVPGKRTKSRGRRPRVLHGARLLPDGMPLSAAHLLYLATRAGAEALGLAAETATSPPGKSADLVRLCPAEGTPPAAAVERAESPERLLGALIAQAGAESVREVRVRGEVVGI